MCHITVYYVEIKIANDAQVEGRDYVMAFVTGSETMEGCPA